MRSLTVGYIETKKWGFFFFYIVFFVALYVYGPCQQYLFSFLVDSPWT